MAILKKGDLLIGDFVLTKEAADLSPSYTMVATDPTRQLAERIEAAQSADALSVALKQPHRLGNRSKSAGDAFAEFCKRMRLRRELRATGEAYCREVRADKAARGFHVVDQHPGEGEPLSEAEQAAKNEAAILALEKSNGLLSGVHPRCPARMEMLCYDRLPPSPYDEWVLINGLLVLAMSYGMLDLGINRDKAG